MGTALWAAVGCLAMLAEAIDPRFGLAASQLGISLLTVAFGVTVFWRHGGRQITAAGLYSLATAVFVGLAGLFWWNQDGNGIPAELHVATAIGFFSTVGMHGLFWRRQVGRGSVYPQVAAPGDQGSALWGMAAGGGIAGGALVLHVAGITLGATLLDEIIFGAMAVLMVSLMTYADRLGGIRCCLVAAVVTVYIAVVFTGYGRLLLVSLCTIALLPACLRAPGRTVKAVVIVAIWPALVALIYQREQFGLATYHAVLDGSGSITQPLADFGRLIALHDRGLLPLGYGSTLVVTALFFVPRVLWPAKPSGFGAVLTQILEPAYAGTDLSLAAHVGGEWFYDFGYPGIAAMVLAIGWAIARLDRFAAARLGVPTTSRRAIVVLSAVVLLMAAIPDLEWVGTFTYWSRTASRLVVPLVLFVVAGHEAAESRPAWRRATEFVARR